MLPETCGAQFWREADPVIHAYSTHKTPQTQPRTCQPKMDVRLTIFND
jgi:hypothetical protein